MKWVHLREIYGQGFRSFVAPFKVRFPESGLTNIRGLNKDTGDSSASGKSSLVLAISYLFGGCPFPGTELTSWGSDEPAMVGAVVSTPEGEWTIERHKGLTIKTSDGRVIKGKAADVELDRLFGMDAWLRAATTYRGQDQGSMFLGMSDPDKKAFFARALQLDRYENIAAEAAEKIAVLKEGLSTAEGRVETAKAYVEAAESSLAEARHSTSDIDISSAKSHLSDLQKAAQKAKQLVRAAIEEADAACAVISAEADAEYAVLNKSMLQASEKLPNPELDEARAELGKVEERLAKVVKHDRARSEERDKQIAELKLRIRDASHSAKSATRLEASLKDMQHQETHLLGQTCPTCKQPWQKKEALVKLEEVRSSIEETKKALLVSEQASLLEKELESQLSSIKPFEPHPFYSQLTAKADELTTLCKKIEACDNAKRTETVKKIQAALTELRSRVSQKTAHARSEHMAVANSFETEAAQLAVAINKQQAVITAAATSQALIKEREEKLEKAKEAFKKADSLCTEARLALHAELDLQALVGKEGFLGVIFADVLAEVAAATNEVLSTVANVRHVTFEFETEKNTKSGSTQRRISPVVIIDGQRVNFNSGLSGGMKSAVGLAVDLGVGEVVAKRRGSYPGWLVLDEAFDGLGKKSKESCLEMLGNYAGDRLVLVIDHATEFQGLFQQVIEVVSENGKSSILS